MKIRRYFGRSIRDAIQRLRTEEGPEAVILSNRQVEGGVELVAAIEFDEIKLADQWDASVKGKRVESHTLNKPDQPIYARKYNPARSYSSVVSQAATNMSASHAITHEAESMVSQMRRELKSLRGLLEEQVSGLVMGEMARRRPALAQVLRQLSRMELDPKIAQRLVNHVDPTLDANSAWREVIGLLNRSVPVLDGSLLERGGIAALVGPTGVGKTTTIAKLAARFSVKHGAKHIALVSTDNYRIGAHEQLRAYARILDVPMHAASTAAELRDVLDTLSDRKLILIDTAGMGQRDLRLQEQFALMSATSPRIDSYLVLSATTRTAGLDEIVRSFRRERLAGCILSKIDEAGSLGGVLSVIMRHRLGVAYLSDGQRVPEDLHMARAPSLVNRAVSLMREGVYRAPSHAGKGLSHAV